MPISFGQPGFSNRTPTYGGAMQEYAPGWSNGEHVEDAKAAQKAHDEETAKTQGSYQIEAGFSNSAPDSDAAVPIWEREGTGTSVNVEKVSDDAETKVVEPAVVEDKAVKKAAPAKRAAKKTTAKKAS